MIELISPMPLIDEILQEDTTYECKTGHVVIKGPEITSDCNGGKVTV